MIHYLCKIYKSFCAVIVKKGVRQCSNVAAVSRHIREEEIIWSVAKEMLERSPSDEAGLVEIGLITPEECVSSRPLPASLAATNYGPYTTLKQCA